jgi:alkylation response protein AidB-like acyl-CoA dehydrogenase
VTLHRSAWMDKDLDQVAELARDFFTKVCAPNEERWGRQQHVDRDVWLKAGELGLLCASIPEEYGGGGGQDGQLGWHRGHFTHRPPTCWTAVPPSTTPTKRPTANT